jgi:hypothetical protein
MIEFRLGVGCVLERGQHLRAEAGEMTVSSVRSSDRHCRTVSTAIRAASGIG